MKEEACWKTCVPFKRVDKRKEGVVKSRLTIADVKSKNPNVEEQEVFSPTPAALAGAIFEVLILKKEFTSVTMGVVSAYPHAKDKEEVDVPFGEAVTG